ncbi:hypothetical protein [Prosthecobacter dejongeii]|nr:hypothetical protein [Prosthecobacter dejongeii]
MFQSGTDPQGQDPASPPAQGYAAAPTMQAPTVSSPFGAQANPLFKTVTGESMQAAPVQASPFAAQGAPSSAVLTVGDVLPQLPPELVRMNALSPEQPVAVAAQVLDAALRSGQAALPIFEIYRVCPALFQTPVSPQDQRMVPLPASKLPRLIASAQQSGAAVPPSGASPFAAAQPAASPFSAQGFPGSPATALPPRRNGPPPPLADIPREAQAPLSLPGAGNHPVFPVSPFAAVAPGMNGAAEAPPASPFGTKSPEPVSAPPLLPASLFASPGAAAASPFAVPTAAVPAATPASPFAAMSPPPAAPAPVASETPFTSLFGPKAVPTGQPAPDAPVRPVAAPPSFAAMPAATVSAPNLRISLASFLRGYSVAELGFDPIMVPTWIMTSQPASLVREWAQSPNPLVELGLLIDGVTDVGFRNVLNHAKRDFQLRVPQEEIQGAMAGTSPPTLPNLASMGTVAPVAAAPMRVEASPPASASPFAAPSAGEMPAPLFQPASGFGSTESAPSVPLFSAPEAPALTPSAPASPSVFPTAPMASLQSPAPAFANPFSMPAAAPQPEASSFEREVSPPPTFQVHTPEAQPPVSNPFMAPAAAEPKPAFTPPISPADGFSSAELLGNTFHDSAPAVPPAPAIPVTNPFTGKTSAHVVDVPEESEPPAPAAAEKAPPPISAFIPPVFEEKEAPARSFPPAPPQKIPSRTAAAAPALGIQSHDANPDQILLRALLGTDDELTPQRIVEMVCALPGIAACVCLQGDRAISHVGAHKPQAREFQRQATDLAHHLRTLAPLIGIEGAETFTLMSGDRLMTFCFPEGAILGVLHDADPSLGLRDKITLIARELSRMLD